MDTYSHLIRRALRRASLLSLATLAVPTGRTEELKWNGGDGVWDLGVYSEAYADGWPAGGTWIGTPNWNEGVHWTNQDSGATTATTGATGPGSGERDTAVFDVPGGGVVQVADVTSTREIGIFGGHISFRESGYELVGPTGGNALIEMNHSTGVEVDAGVTATIGSGVTVIMTAWGSHSNVGGGGTLNLKGVLARRSSGVFELEDHTTLNVLEGGELGGDHLGNNMYIGESGPGTLVVDGGDVKVGNGSQNRSLIVGMTSSAAGSSVTLNEGRIFILDYGTARVELGRSGSGSTAFHLNGGVLQTPSIMSDGGDALFRFNGGLLQIPTDADDLFTGVDNVLVGTEPARISCGDALAGYTVVLAEPLRHDPALGVTRDGGLIKQDHGTLTLAPGNTYTGDTVVERGALVLSDAFLDDDSAVHLGPSARLELNHDDVDTIAALYIDGEPLPPGTWGAPGSGAARMTPKFSGNGVLQVAGQGDPLPPIEYTEGPDLGPDYDPDVIASIPDPLVMENGDPVTTPEDWLNTRRDEILELFREHVYGRNAVERPADMEFTLVSENTIFGGDGVKRVVNIHYANGSESDDFNVYLYMPPDGVTPKGIFLLINNRSESYTTRSETYSSGSGGYAFLPSREIIERGYIAASFKNRHVADDETDLYDKDIFRVFGPGGTLSGGEYPDRPDDAWAAIAGWAWGASRCIDYFESAADLKDLPVATVGHSRGGKASLWCGAQDERVDLAISNSSGCTGAAMSRTTRGESVGRINSAFPHWFCDNYKDYGGRETELPVDQHMLLALCAPRLVYVQSSSEDYNADPGAEFESCLRAGPVYELFGHPPVASRRWPGSNTPLHDTAIGYHSRGDGYEGDDGTGGWHDMVPYDWHRFMDFADQHLANHSPDLRSWRLDHGLDVYGGDDMEQPAGDGVPNVMKYALNLPEEGDTLSTPAPSMPFDGDAGLPAVAVEKGGFRFQYVRRKPETDPGIRYQVERSADLLLWDPVDTPVAVEDLGGGWERATYGEPVDSIASGRIFYRLYIEHL